MIEFSSNTKDSINHEVLEIQSKGIQIVSIKEAWTAKKFSQNHYFPGTAFRVYQARVLFELLNEELKWWGGYGLDGSYIKLEEKALKYDIYRGSEDSLGYQKHNFHNQYLQIIADLGLLGFSIIALLLISLLKNNFQQKAFLPLAFTVIMITLFITECFLWRQRGVTFFTIMTLLFYNKNHLNKPLLQHPINK